MVTNISKDDSSKMLKVIGLDKDTKSYAPSYIYTAIDTKCKAIHLAKDAQGDLPYLGPAKDAICKTICLTNETQRLITLVMVQNSRRPFPFLKNC